MAELHVIGDDFLSCLDSQVTGDAVRFEVALLADDEPQQGLECLRLFDAQVAFIAVSPRAVLAVRSELPVLEGLT